MTTYNETSSGGASLRGCATVEYIDFYLTTFGVGDILYNKFKATKGILEKVVIRKVHMVPREFVYGGLFFYYEDNLHSLWNEEDLVSHEEAVDLSIAYYELVALEEERLDKC